MFSSAKMGEPMRMASAMASDGRLDTVRTSPPVLRTISAKNVPSRSAVTVIRST
jgi:hypothetical protein